MKLGIYLNGQHPAGDDPARRFAETLEQARLIRQLGFGIELLGREVLPEVRRLTTHR